MTFGKVLGFSTIYYVFESIDHSCYTKGGISKMTAVSPSRILFESPVDLADYVSEGCPPSKKNYEEFVSSISDGGINNKVILNVSAAEMQEILGEVYKNNRKNYGKAVIGSAASFVGGILFAKRFLI